MSGAGAASGRLFAYIQHVLPQHGLSRVVLAATRVRIRWFKNLLIRAFLAGFAVDMSEAAETDPYRYPCFNDFFTRALAQGARPIAPASTAIASPVDGTVSECGAVQNGLLLQAKGRHYSLADLLARQEWARRFEAGSFATIYLAPFNYHRIHMRRCAARSRTRSSSRGVCSASMRPPPHTFRGSLPATNAY